MCTEQAIELLDRRLQILTYVESRMSYIAPNLSIIVGASTAAKLMGMIRTLFYGWISFNLDTCLDS